MAEILNNEAGGTGCGMDALAVWTSTRGKCAEGEFMSLAGASYNAVPVPLGVGLPACTQTTEKKSTRSRFGLGSGRASRDTSRTRPR